MTTERLTVPLYQPTDILIQGTTALDNPFFAELHGTFSGPGGTYSIPGFYDGNGIWKVRFSPTALGTWTYTISSPHIRLNTTSGQIECVPNRNPNVHGGLRVCAPSPSFSLRRRHALLHVCL